MASGDSYTAGGCDLEPALEIQHGGSDRLLDLRRVFQNSPVRALQQPGVILYPDRKAFRWRQKLT